MIEKKTGAVIFVGDTEVVNDKFSKRIVVIDTTEIGPDGRAFDNIFPCEFTNNRTTLLDSVAVGQEVTISYTLQGKEYQGKYYLSARGVNVQPVIQGQPHYPSQVGQRPQGGYAPAQQPYAPAAPQGYQPAAPQGYQPAAPQQQQGAYPGYPSYSPYPDNAPGNPELPWQR